MEQSADSKHSPQTKPQDETNPKRTKGFLVNTPDHRKYDIAVTEKTGKLLDEIRNLTTSGTTAVLRGFTKTNPTATITTGKGPKAAVIQDPQDTQQSAEEKRKQMEARKENIAQKLAKKLIGCFDLQKIKDAYSTTLATFENTDSINRWRLLKSLSMEDLSEIGLGIESDSNNEKTLLSEDQKIQKRSRIAFQEAVVNRAKFLAKELLAKKLKEIGFSELPLNKHITLRLVEIENKTGALQFILEPD